MKRILLILLAVFFSFSAAFAVTVWDAVADFNPVNAPQNPNAVWTYRQAGTWNSPPLAEGELWTYMSNALGGFSGYGGGAGRNEVITNPTNGYGGAGADEFMAWTPMVRWLSPINGKIQVQISARQQDAPDRHHIAILSKNGVQITTTGNLLIGANTLINEFVDVVIGDRIDFKIVTIDTAYYCIFKETITFGSDPIPDPNVPSSTFWDAVADFNPVSGAQNPNAVWTYRQAGNWGGAPAEGTLLNYASNVGVPQGAGNLGAGYQACPASGNAFIVIPTGAAAGWGGALGEFVGSTPMVRWLSPVNGKVHVQISARQQDAASRHNIGILSKNDVQITATGNLLTLNVNTLIDEFVDVVVGDRIDFKIVTTDLPYWCIFKEAIALVPDPNAPRPAFYAYKNTVQAIPRNDFGTEQSKVHFDGVEFDSGGTFNLATSTWQPRRIGIGHISAGVSWAGGLESGQDIEIHIFKNGVYHRAILGAAAGTGGQSAPTQIDAYVIVDGIADSFAIQLFQNGSSSKNIDAAWFSGRMVK